MSILHHKFIRIFKKLDCYNPIAQNGRVSIVRGFPTLGCDSPSLTQNHCK